MTAGASEPVVPGLSREVFGILRRHWFAAAWPAALLGAAADGVTLLHDHVVAEVALGLVIAVAFELYVGYAELIVAADRGEGPRPAAGPHRSGAPGAAVGRMTTRDSRRWSSSPRQAGRW